MFCPVKGMRTKHHRCEALLLALAVCCRYLGPLSSTTHSGCGTASHSQSQNLQRFKDRCFILTCSVLLGDSWHHSCEPSELCHAVLCSKCSKDNLARVAALWFGEFKDNIDRNHGTSRNQGANRTHQVLKPSVAQSNATSNVFRHAPFGWFVLGSILLKHSQV